MSTKIRLDKTIILENMAGGMVSAAPIAPMNGPSGLILKDTSPMDYYRKTGQLTKTSKKYIKDIK